MLRKCIHCLGRVKPPAEICEACLDLLSDLGEEEEPEPQPRPAPVATHRGGPFEPSREDLQAYCELSERGSFRPFDDVRPKQRPSHATDRWGKALASLKRSRRDPDVPKQ
jgi:hypothetical protein